MRHTQRFQVGHLVYRLTVRDDFVVVLRLIDGFHPRKGSLFHRLYDPLDPFGTVYTTLADIDLADSAWPVLNTARAILVGWIKRARPGYLVIATDSPRKRRIYRRLARRALRALPAFVVLGLLLPHGPPPGVHRGSDIDNLLKPELGSRFTAIAGDGEAAEHNSAQPRDAYMGETVLRRWGSSRFYPLHHGR